MGVEYDFFLAHAGPDGDVARRLFAALRDEARVFLDCEVLKAGESWDIVLAAAQRASRVTVILVSARVAAAWYLRDEIARAIRLARESEHRIAPVLLDADGPVELPYGLACVQALSLRALGTIEAVAARLLERLDLTPGVARLDDDPPAASGPLTRAQVDRLVEIALHRRAGRDGLLLFLPAGVRGRLSKQANDYAQLESDVVELDGMGAVRGVSGPALAVWLDNLASHVAPFPRDAEYVREVRLDVLRRGP